MFYLFEKIKYTQLALVNWGKVTFGNTKVQLKKKTLSTS